MIELRDYQKSLVARIYSCWDRAVSNVLTILPTGGGKCLGKGTPILMFDGTVRPVEDVTVGDLLMGPDSAPRKVMSLARGRERLFRVVPNKGDEYIVNESHILSLRISGSDIVYDSLGRGFSKGDICNISVRDYLRCSKTFKHVAKGWRTGVNFQEKEVPFDPYLFGVWLGDGSSRTASFTTMDPEIVDAIEKYAAESGSQVRVENNAGRNNAKNYHLTTDYSRDFGMRKFLKEYNLLENKHIPLVFLTASRRDRLNLLAGLMDTDGSYTGKGFDFVQKDGALFDQVLFLARSLGFAAYKSEQYKSCQTGSGGWYYRCSISGNISEIPTRLPRKKAAERKINKDVTNVGFYLDDIGEGDYYGFEITGDRLFLLGDFTVTHNTVTFSFLVMNHPEACAVMVHRQELVGQISLTLAKFGIFHDIIASEATVRAIVESHMDQLGKSFYDHRSKKKVCSVDTMVIRTDPDFMAWCQYCTLLICDEAHHITAKLGVSGKENKWKRAFNLVPNAKLLGVTATPCRGDGVGLGSESGGIFQEMVEGPSMRWLIDSGFLSDYRIFCAPEAIDVAKLHLASDGDFKPKELADAWKGSSIVGDVVSHYIKHAAGKRGITFCVNIEHAEATRDEFIRCEVPAAVLTGATPIRERARIIKALTAGEILQLVSVDVISEGFDVPSVEVISMARPTASYGLFAQQFGRGLRTMPGKPFAIILDHVGNVIRHLPPDMPRKWELNPTKKSKKAGPGGPPMRACIECSQPYEIHLDQCPHCGALPPIPEVKTIETVNGDLAMLDPATLALMRAALTPTLKIPYGASDAIIGRLRKVFHEKVDTVNNILAPAMDQWGGVCTHILKETVPEQQRRFFLTFGVDVLAAQALSSAESISLAEKIHADTLRLLGA